MANMLETENLSNPPKIILDYASPRLRKPRKPAKPPGRWLTVVAALAGGALFINAPLLGFAQKKDAMHEDWIPLLVWMVCGIVWTIRWFYWYFIRSGGIECVVPASRWRFYQIPVCMLISTLSLFDNFKLHTAFFLSQPWMNAVARQAITTGTVLPDRQVGLFRAIGIAPWRSDVAFSINHTGTRAFYFSATGPPPALWNHMERLDQHWYYCESGSY